MIRRPPRSTPLYSSAASDVYKRQAQRSMGHDTWHAGASLAWAAVLGPYHLAERCEDGHDDHTRPWPWTFAAQHACWQDLGHGEAALSPKANSAREPVRASYLCPNVGKHHHLWSSTSTGRSPSQWRSPGLTTFPCIGRLTNAPPRVPALELLTLTVHEERSSPSQRQNTAYCGLTVH